MKGQKYYKPDNHVDNLVSKAYYKNLIKLRNVISLECDSYFYKKGAPKVDLFLIAKSVSSPTGKGSDSIPIKLEFGRKHTYLVDSAQFGMEPLVLEQFKMVYCYLPSFRGENADSRHLNQFYHCEAEMRGGYLVTLRIAEELVKHLITECINSAGKKIYTFEKDNFTEIKSIPAKKFPIVTFDEIEKLFNKKGISELIEKRPYGRVLSRDGETKVAELVGNNKVPVWVTNYDRDTVPFYQKPDPKNPDQVLNADLIFPSINGGFGGEIVGAGQRQNNINEIRESIKRQAIKEISQYNWYIKLREHPKYKITSGFGLGMERFIAWMLGLPSIIDTAIYPVIKNEELIC